MRLLLQSTRSTVQPNVQVNNGGCLIDSDPFLYEGVSITTAPQPGTATNPPVTTTVTAPLVTATEPVLSNEITLRHAPNPVGQSAQVFFTLPKATQLTLRLLTVMGASVQILAEGRYLAGSYRFTVDTTKLPAGLYLYRLETERGTTTNKMMVTH